MDGIESLKKRWAKATGNPMPPEVQDLEREVIRRAVKRVENGEIVFVPKTAINPATEPESSMVSWDSQDRMW